MPSRDAAARCAHRRLGRALLLAAGAGAAAGARPAAALHVVRRVRGATGEARRPRPQARRRVPRPRRREPARRPRGGGAERRRLLRQEHAPDHAAPRLLGRARDARHRRRARADCRLSTSTVASAGSASTPARPARSTSRARSTRPAVSATGRRRPRLLPRRIAPSSGRRSTAATSARTSARGIGASRSGARGSRCPRTRLRTFRSSSGCARSRTSCGGASRGSTCLATTGAASSSTLLSRQATWGATANGTP